MKTKIKRIPPTEREKQETNIDRNREVENEKDVNLNKNREKKETYIQKEMGKPRKKRENIKTERKRMICKNN